MLQSPLSASTAVKGRVQAVATGHSAFQPVRHNLPCSGPARMRGLKGCNDLNYQVVTFLYNRRTGNEKVTFCFQLNVILFVCRTNLLSGLSNNIASIAMFIPPDCSRAEADAPPSGRGVQCISPVPLPQASGHRAGILRPDGLRRRESSHIRRPGIGHRSG